MKIPIEQQLNAYVASGVNYFILNKQMIKNKSNKYIH